MERLHLNDMETQLEPIFVYFKQSRQPEGFEVLRSRWFRANPEFAASYEFQTAAEAEITDDSDVW